MQPTMWAKLYLLYPKVDCCMLGVAGICASEPGEDPIDGICGNSGGAR